LVSEDELSDDTKELIAETKKDLNEIERVVGEFQVKQEEMRKVVGKAEAEVERLEAKELDIVRELKTGSTSLKAKNSNTFTLMLWIFSLVVVAFFAISIQYAPIEYIILLTCQSSWEGLSDKWEYMLETVFDYFGIERPGGNAPF
jgi:uncharacterized membrane protein (DUF106 family)